MIDKKIAAEHIKNHVSGYPTTKADLVAACNNMSDFSDADKKEFADKLPDGTYNTPEDVMKALGW